MLTQFVRPDGMCLYVPVLKITLEIHSLGAKYLVRSITFIALKIFYVGTLEKLTLTLNFSTVPNSEAKQKVPCSDCGPNADCIDSQCRCKPAFFGSPPFCRYECLSSSDCDGTRTCINKRCVDPCPGACGQGAICTPVAHEPRCDCPPETRGNPLVACRPENTIRKTDTPGFFFLITKDKTFIKLLNRKFNVFSR